MKRLYKSRKDKKLCGVCGGLAEYFGIDPTIIRFIWAALVVFFGTGAVVYILAAFILPERPLDDNNEEIYIVDEQ